MRRKIMMVFVVFCLVLLNSDLPGKDMEKERVAIKKAVLDYIEGWFEGNAERMDRALHQDLTKRTPIKNPQTGESMLRVLTKKQMVEFTQRGGGKTVPKDKLGIKVTILDVYRNIATAKSECFQFIDYLHLAKTNGKWQIVNVLWEGVRTERKVAKVDPGIYNNYVGEYELQPGFILTVTTKDEKIFVQATNQPQIEVFPESETEYFLKVTEAQITFVKDTAGKVTHLILHQGGRDMPAKKIK